MPSAPKIKPTQGNINRVTIHGFTIEESRWALEQTGNDVMAAIDLLTQNIAQASTQVARGNDSTSERPSSGTMAYRQSTPALRHAAGPPDPAKIRMVKDDPKR